MGCSASKESVLVSDSTERGLTQDEKELIRKSWSKLGPVIHKVGEKVFLTLFDQHPCIKGMFPFRNFCGNELLHHPDFIIHVKRFTRVIQMAVTQLDEVHKGFSLGLKVLGERHQTIPVFYPEYFEIFNEALQSAIEHELKLLKYDSIKILNAWRKIITLIVETLQKGYFCKDQNHTFFI